MERPKCKLCSRTFANGRALGGHMKAHLATLPVPPKPRQPTTEWASLSSTSPSAAASSSRGSTEEENEDDKGSIYGLRENPRRSLKFSDPEFSSPNEAALLFQYGEESDAESTRRRLTRPRRQPCAAAEEEEEEEEEDAAIAMCLVMLSRDKRAMASVKSDVKRHRCKVCNKVFRSSQALGGHRVTHRKVLEEAGKRQRRLLDDAGEKIFECPYCFKVFSSGQALGGHKRSHLIGSDNGSQVSSGKARNREKNSFIDLNLPAPPEEDDDRSVVSDGEITEPPERNF